MARRGNPKWGHGGEHPIVVSPTQFEQKCIELGLDADRVAKHRRTTPQISELRQWCEQKSNLNHRYIPESLLKRWRLWPDILDVD